MTTQSWVIDKSALARLGVSPHATEWANRIGRGLVHITPVTLLEVGYSARSASEMAQAVSTPPVSAMPIDYSTPAIENRAIDVQRQLAERGQHRAASIPDLLVAASAEISNRIVLHMDKDFELIADITGQPLERLVL